MNLRPHQETSRKFLATHPRAYLGDEPRVGKTPAAIMAAKDVGAEVITVACPAVMVGTWQHEWYRWWPEFEGALEVVSYDRLIRMSAVTRMGADLVILDEAHYCKNTTSKRTRASIALGRNATRTWLLSGTPMPNHPGELFAPLAGFWPEKLRALGVRNYEGWLNLTCNWKNIQVGPRTWVPKVFSAKDPALVRGLIADIMLRRTFKEVSGRDSIWWSTQTLEPTRAQIAEVANSIVVGSGVDMEWLAERLERGEDLEGISDHIAKTRRIIGTIKAPMVAAVLREELREDPARKVFVVGYHTDVLHILRSELQEFSPNVIEGSTPKWQRDVIVQQFQQQESVRVLIGQHMAAGTGITLDRATEVAMAEMVWTPGDNQQVANRASSTEKGTVPVRVFSLAGTIDEAVNDVLVRKEQMQTEVGL